MPRLLITSSTGPADPTRASIPFHIAANGAAPAGVDCGIALAGDATAVLAPGAAAGVRGIGVPPLEELLDECRSAGIQVYV